MNKKEQLELYHQMVLIRRVEEHGGSYMSKARSAALCTYISDGSRLHRSMAARHRMIVSSLPIVTTASRSTAAFLQIKLWRSCWQSHRHIAW